MSASAPIYLDYNATTPPAEEVIAAMAEFMRSSYGNPSSTHALGQAAKQALGQARVSVAKLLGASPAEVVFTSGATEANQLAIMGSVMQGPAKRHLIVSAVEHPSVIAQADRWEAAGGAVTRIGVDGEGRIDLAALAAALRSDTALVSVMWVNNETGVISPVAEIAALTQAAGVRLHVDATQAVGRIPVGFAASGIDLLSCSAHKLYGPKGVGALVVRKGVSLVPQLPGHQERTRRGGTENAPGIVGFGVAAALAAERMAEQGAIATLRDRFEAALLARVPATRITAASAPRVANTSNLRFDTLDAEAVLNKLDRAGICASSGSACTAGGTEPSHVLIAMGRGREEALAALRISLGRHTTAEHIDRTIEALTQIVSPRLERAA